MGAKYTQGQAKATAKYMQDKHRMVVFVDKEEAERYKKAAEERGFPSLNKFIIHCIENEIGRG